MERRPVDPMWHAHYSMYPYAAMANGIEGPTDGNTQRVLTESVTFQHQLPAYLQSPSHGPSPPPSQGDVRQLPMQRQRKKGGAAPANHPPYRRSSIPKTIPQPDMAPKITSGPPLEFLHPDDLPKLIPRGQDRSMLTLLGEATHHTPSTENSSNYPVNVINAYQQRPDYTPQDCINDIRKICNETQARVQALGQAIGRQPGMPGSLTELLNNDMRVIAQQFASTAYHARMIEKKLQERGRVQLQERESELKHLKTKLQNSQDRVRKLEESLHSTEEGYATADKRRKVELEKKAEKIQNQKRRIKEQQDQIDNLKKRTGDGKGSKSSRATSRAYEDSSPEPEFALHSATSEIGGRKSPRLPEPKYSSTLSGKDEEFLMENLRKLHMDPHSGGSFPSLPTSRTRMERDNHVNHATGGPPPHLHGHFGHSMPMGPMGPMGPIGPPPMDPMNGAFAPYGVYPPMGAYGPPPGPHYGRGPPPSGQMPPYPGYGVPSFQGTSQPNQTRRSNSHSQRASESQPSNALVLRRNDDSEIDPETKIWKELFSRLFQACHGWTADHCKDITPGAAEAATKGNPRLWEYILKTAYCYKDSQAAPKHALFMLNSPDHRQYFIERLILQYVEQEMLHWKFWLGWDDEIDLELNKYGPIIDYIGYPLDQRRDARQKVRRIVENIVKDEEYSRFRTHKTTVHANRLKDIAGPFVSKGPGNDASLGLHSMANMGMELSNKMMTSRLSFSFTWNECAVKFCHDSHIALNNQLHGISLQQKHVRIALVITPSISYRDDSGISIVPRGVAKAQVLVMS